MSGNGHGVPAAGAAGADPSMEDILASIRRILSEDDAGAGATKPVAAVASPPSPTAHDDVFALEESMLVREPPVSPAPGPSPLAALGSFMTAPTQPNIAANQMMPQIQVSRHREQDVASEIELQATAAPVAAPAAPAPPPFHEAPSHEAALVGPEAAAAAAASMGNLMRTLTADRHTAVYRGGPTLEDMVRDEMRPMLKNWLDTYLPAMVERLVRAEIERVAGRAAH